MPETQAFCVGDRRSGRGGRRFESFHSDQHFSEDDISLRLEHDFPILLSKVQSLFCGVSQALPAQAFRAFASRWLGSRTPTRPSLDAYTSRKAHV